MCAGTEREQGLTVIMVGHIMAMSMERPVKVLFQPMGVAMIGDHLSMIGNNLEHGWGVACAWRNGPDHKRQAKQSSKRTPSECSQEFHRFACLPVFSPRHADRAVLFYPLGEDSVCLCQSLMCTQPTPLSLPG